MQKFGFHKNVIPVLLIDVLLFSFALYGSYHLRFDFNIPEPFRHPFTRVLPFSVGLKLLCFYMFGSYRGMWRYTSITDMLNIIKASTFASLLIIAALTLLSRFEGFPRSVFLIDWGFTILLVSSFRVMIRFWFEFRTDDKNIKADLVQTVKRIVRMRGDPNKKRMVIIGAGDCGEKIFREIRGNTHLGIQVVGFVDDNPRKHKLKIHGIPVLGSVDAIDAIARRHQVEEFLIAIPSANSRQIRRILGHCKNSGVKYKTIPSYGELINGQVSVNSIRDVAYRDLLGRDIVQLESELIGKYISGRRVLITGAGGSIGSELCRQACRFKPRRIILYERAESPLHDIELELRHNYPEVEICPVLGDILDNNLLAQTFAQEKPACVFHAAAYKHVPMLERQPWKAVENNICGTFHVAEMANRYHVGRFVFVSTDKAVRPANIMGTSKRIAEMIVQCQVKNHEARTRFMIVRFGNVVGSVGSVVPLFKKQIARGGPVTVTHPKVTRFFMTIPEACQLILQAGAMGRGGEVFILDMGIPIKIDDMARDLIRLSGFEPDVDIPIEYIGLRPGEKLYEELITVGEGIVPTEHKNILVLQGNSCNWDELRRKIEKLKGQAASMNAHGIREAFKSIVPEYQTSEVERQQHFENTMKTIKT
jgi:FlaA1/EpsC-like NDP-sugar epimerase